ncbi:MAG: helix-turn-helix transcriptional regulator [Tyzzerella sp.]|nr:helix-turn-helix transcriptional regulator [Tyzzerella sp.]
MEKCYDLLKNVLLDAFNVPAVYFTPPYQDIRKIDQGMRAFVWTNYNDRNTKVQFTDLSKPYRILIIKSNLGFYNVLVFFGADEKPDFISIGPFRNNELSANYFTQILKDAHITPSTMQRMKHLYEGMPFVQVDTIVNVTQHILGAFIPEFKELTPEFIEYADHKRPIEVNTNLIEQNFLDFSTRYHKLLSAFLAALKCGDNEKGKKALQTLFQESKFTTNLNLRNYKMLLQALNDYCHMALLETDIHPSHVLKQAFSIGVKIDSITSLTKLRQLPNEICRKYCLLVKNYSNPDFSKITKDVMAYVEFHLDEDLSLNQLAGHFKKNASALSNIFSKEAGQTLTNFIQQTRMQEAIRLFNTTHMSVSEVATAVGYHDFAYFSKLFSKIIGISPRAYRQKGMHSAD